MATNTPHVNFSESRQTEIYVVAWVLTGIAIATVSLKLYARAIITKRLGWDDFFIFLALAFSIVSSTLVTYSTSLGFGRHTAAIVSEYGPERLVLITKWLILGYPFNTGAFSFPNISIAILVNNILDPSPLRTRCLFALVILQVVFALASVFVIFLQCSPVAALWNYSISAKCWNHAIFNDLSYWVSAYTSFTDIVLAVVPISVFWRLQMPFSTKLRVCIMMSLTLLSAIVTIIKATYLRVYADRTHFYFDVVPSVLWGLAEHNVVIFAACVPTVRPVFQKGFGSKSSKSIFNTSRTRSEPSFKMCSKPSHSGSRGLPSISELPLDESQQNGYDAESKYSQQGIRRTTEVTVESDEKDLGASVESRFKDPIPASLI